jgi:uncharacterized membrane protein
MTMQDAPRVKPMSLHEFRMRRRPMRNINVEMRENLSGLDRLAVWITTHVGTMGFFLLILAWTVSWLGWNFFAPDALKFDAPMGFVFWLFLSNLIHIFAHAPDYGRTERDRAACRSSRGTRLANQHQERAGD